MEQDIIAKYFWDGFQYRTILRLLDEYHGITMSFSTLRRRLQDLGLSRRSQSHSLQDIMDIIQTELRGPGWKALQKG